MAKMRIINEKSAPPDCVWILEVTNVILIDSNLGGSIKLKYGVYHREVRKERKESKNWNGFKNIESIHGNIFIMEKKKIYCKSCQLKHLLESNIELEQKMIKGHLR